MNKVLLKWNSSWADEFDVSGFSVMKMKDWEDYKESLRNRKLSFTLYVGTNEWIEYPNGQELLNEIKVEEISDQAEEVLFKYFEDGFGFLDFLYAAERFEEGEE